MIPHTRPLWFKRKRYGWGWYPVTWQGWLVIVDFVVLLIANTTRLNIKVRPENTPWFIGETLVMVVILILVCYRTGESPRWQWGGLSLRDEDHKDHAANDTDMHTRA